MGTSQNPPPAFLPLAQRAPLAKVHTRPAQARWRTLDPASLVVLASLVALIVERLTAVAGDMHLFADGSWWLLSIAAHQKWHIWITDWHQQWFQSRIFTILGEQTPTVLASRMGVRSLHSLSLVFGATLYGHVLISIYLCYRYAAKRWYLLFPLLSLYAGSMNAEAFPANDSHFVVSLYWPMLFILLFQEEIKGGTLGLLLLLAVPFVLTYETTLFFGVILAGVGFWRINRFSKQKKLAAALGIWYLICATMALASILIPFDPTNRSGFVNGLLSVVHSDHLGVKVSLVVLSCCSLLLWTTINIKYVQDLLAGAGIIVSLYEAFRVLVGKAPVSLNSQVGARVMNLVAPLAATALLLFILVGLAKPDRRAVRLMAVVIGMLGIAQALYGLGCVMRWQGMLATLRYELVLHDGPVAYSETVLSREQLGPLHLRELHASWPLLPLSIYTSELGNVKSIVLPPAGAFLPFDPLAPDAFPDLARYGVHYDQYATALKRNWQYELGETLTFSKGGSGGRFLTGSWSYPEDWAIWAEKENFGLKIPVKETDVPTEVMLQARVVPSLSPRFPNSSMDVLVNGYKVGTWQFSYLPEFNIRTQEVLIPRQILTEKDPVEIQFHMNQPVPSPTEMGTGQDPRRLAVAFLSLRIYKKELH